MGELLAGDGVMPDRSIIESLSMAKLTDWHPILIGTAAIHWDFARRGGDSRLLPLKDVDVLCEQSELEEISIITGVPYKDRRLMIEPDSCAKRLGAKSLDIVSDSDSYDDPLVYTHSHERIYAFSFTLDKHVSIHKGVSYITLPTAFWWKAAIGRKSDMDTLYQTIKLLNDQRLFDRGEPRSLFKAIDAGRDGLDYLYLS